MVTLHEVITFLVSMQISISSLQTHNVNRCGRSRHLARKLSLRRKRSSPNVFEMAATETITSIILIKLIRVSLGTDRDPRRFKIVVIDIQITLKQMLRVFIGIRVNRAKKSGMVNITSSVNATPLPTVNTTGYIDHAVFLSTINLDNNKIPKHLFQGYLNIYNNYFKAPWMPDRTEANPNELNQDDARYGFRCCHLKNIWTAPLPPETELSRQMMTSTTSIDIMGLQAAYANLHTDRERDYFMQR